MEPPIEQRKTELRQSALKRRRRQADKDALSRRILERVFTLDDFVAASTVMFYIDARSEVRTRFALEDRLTRPPRDKDIVLPYCADGDLVPLRVTSLDDLAPGAYGILEPRDELRGVAARQVELRAIDLVLVPGLAFDRGGGRLGSGRGYYDRLIPRLRDDVVLIGLAFACQMVEKAPAAPHDVPVNFVVTEDAIYRA